MKQLSRVLMCAAMMLFLSSGQGYAVTGVCSGCHTMHNSQGGVDEASNFDTTTNANPQLLKGDCLGCHAKGGTETIIDEIPQVFTTAGGSILAAGTFADVVVDETRGHNVATLCTGDSALVNTPPGGSVLGGQLTCSGTNGCHGNRGVDSTLPGGQMAAMSGSHHGNNADGVANLGTTIGNSYRFLDTVTGLEDPDWENSVTSLAHNQYQGAARSGEAASATENTISALCGACHGTFHAGTGNIGSSGFSSPWIRHPTDLDLADAATEHQSYGTYDPAVPVASVDATGLITTPGMTPGDEEAIVMCLSCHRAHGSGQADMLRFDYSTISAGGGDTGGCFVCHTGKI